MFLKKILNLEALKCNFEAILGANYNYWIEILEILSAKEFGKLHLSCQVRKHHGWPRLSAKITACFDVLHITKDL